MNRGRNIGLKMTKNQYVLGWLYLPFYLVLLGLGLRLLAGVLGLEVTNFQLNLTYFAINFVVILSIYHSFLRKSLRGFTEHFWQFVQVVILGFALYYFVSFALTMLVDLLDGTLPQFNDEVVGSYVAENPKVMMICTIVVAPIVEEVLIRGVIFGSVHGKSRILAFVLSGWVFCAMHVWRFADAGLWAMFRSALQYIPASVALGWTYEKSGTIWGSIVLHAIINAIAMTGI